MKLAGFDVQRQHAKIIASVV